MNTNGTTLDKVNAVISLYDSLLSNQGIKDTNNIVSAAYIVQLLNEIKNDVETSDAELNKTIGNVE